MRSLPLIMAGLALIAGPLYAESRAQPTVVELFQSQGCSSCPPADLVLNGLADRPDVLALSFAVTYWDQLGWKDSFASPAFTQRQWDYASHNRRDGVGTPQMIVNGMGFILGSRRAEADAAIARYARHVPGPALDVDGRQVTVGAGPAGASAILWLVRYDPRTIAVAIGAGENAGRTLPHRNIVRVLVPLGAWHGKPARFAIPAAADSYAGAVLLQQGKGGPIIAALKL